MATSPLTYNNWNYINYIWKTLLSLIPRDVCVYVCCSVSNSWSLDFAYSKHPFNLSGLCYNSINQLLSLATKHSMINHWVLSSLLVCIGCTNTYSLIWTSVSRNRFKSVVRAVVQVRVVDWWNYSTNPISWMDACCMQNLVVAWSGFKKNSYKHRKSTVQIEPILY